MSEDGGERFLPYGRQTIEEEDIRAVVEVLRSDWLTTGPKVPAFEEAFADWVGAREAVAVNSGTAALHAAIFAIEIGPGDEVIVPALTFAATANCVVYQGGTPVFADVDKDTLCVDPQAVEERITPRTRAILAVDYGGQPCDYDALHAVADRHGILLLADACHSLGGSWSGVSVGRLAALNTFSFHPVKPITSAEGGMVTTDDPALAKRMRRFRNHGITTDHRERQAAGSWFYEMIDLGYNYRLNDLQCALGLSQLRRLREWVARRREIAALYDDAFETLDGVVPLVTRPEAEHAYHLYVVRVVEAEFGCDRDAAFKDLRGAGIGVNVHYVPVPLHPFYRDRQGGVGARCPVAEEAYREILSLPIFPQMGDADIARVVARLEGLKEASRPA